MTLIDGAQEQVLVELARPERRRMRCPHCSFQTRATYDRSMRAWRHLDALRTRCLLRCEVRRIVCPDCGVVSEEVPWARTGSRFTRAFEDTCAFLVRDAPKTVVAQLMRIDWATVGRVLERVVDEALGQSEDWLDGLRRIGVDEVAYRKGHRYLLCVVDHDTGRIVWAHPGRSKATLALFFAALGPERAGLLKAVSVDLHGAWPPVIRTFAPQAAICADPFHVIKLAGDALDLLRRAEWQRLRKEDPERARWFKGTRFLLRRRAEGLSDPQRDLIEQLAQTNERVYRGWLLLDQLRAIYAVPDPAEAARLLAEWCEAAWRSELEPFRKTALTLADHAEAICNAIRLGLNNARIEAMNSTVRLRRSVSLVPQLRKELTAYLPEDGRLDELLFTPGDHAAASRDAKPLLLSNWRRRVWVPAVAASGIAPCTPYDGRRTFISLMIHAGATPVEVAAEVGHSNPRMIWERYATLFRAAQKVPKLPIAEQIARARKELARGRKRGNVPQMFPKSEAKALRRSPKAA